MALSGGTWKKGQSGNPTGRPKSDYRIKELAKQHTEVALKTLAQICAESENDSARVAAAEALLNRGWGRPAQPVEHSGELINRHVSELTDAELIDIAAGRSPGTAEEAQSPAELAGVH